EIAHHGEDRAAAAAAGPARASSPRVIRRSIAVEGIAELVAAELGPREPVRQLVGPGVAGARGAVIAAAARSDVDRPAISSASAGGVVGAAGAGVGVAGAARRR